MTPDVEEFRTSPAVRRDEVGELFDDAAVVVAGRVPFEEIFGERVAVRRAGGAGIFDSGGTEQGDHALVVIPEGVGHPADDVACGTFENAAVLLDFEKHRHIRLIDREGMACHVAGNFVTGVDFCERFFGITGENIAGIEVERAFDAVLVEDFKQTRVFRNAVVVAHRKTMGNTAVKPVEFDNVHNDPLFIIPDAVTQNRCPNALHRLCQSISYKNF